MQINEKMFSIIWQWGIKDGNYNELLPHTSKIIFKKSQKINGILIQPSWRKEWSSLKKQNTDLICVPAIKLLGICKGNNTEEIPEYTDLWWSYPYYLRYETNLPVNQKKNGQQNIYTCIYMNTIWP